MDTRHLRAFLKIADMRSISRAADSLGIAQPSLSQQLLRLEDEVGVKLFRRSARGVVVTEAGRVFQEHARQILRAEAQALEDVRQLDAAPGGHVTFAMPPSVAALIGVPLVEAIKREAPHVAVRLVESFSGNIRGWLEGGRVDMGIVYDTGPLRNLSTRRLVSEELVLVGPAGAFAENADVPPERIGACPLIVPGPQHGLRQVLEQEAARWGFALDVAHEIDALGQIVALVAGGHGYALLPRTVVSAAAEGRVSLARIGEGAIRRTLSLVRNPAQIVTHASLRVEDLTLRVLADLIETGQWQAEAEAALP
ncbi:MAG: LysR family transcriptional regulator [Novosphingobium sp.]